MSKEMVLGLLRTGKTGTEILQILDTIVNDTETDTSEPTLEEIQF
jgi:hypothetical protein